MTDEQLRERFPCDACGGKGTVGPLPGHTRIVNCVPCKGTGIDYLAAYNATKKDAAFYRCCALSGETPEPGSEPSATSESNAIRGDLGGGWIPAADDNLAPLDTNHTTPSPWVKFDPEDEGTWPEDGQFVMSSDADATGKWPFLKAVAGAWAGKWWRPLLPIDQPPAEDE